MQRPEKPYAGFPLSANLNGQWYKKVRGKAYYFGSWTADPTGIAALAEFNHRWPAIAAGTDHLTAVVSKGTDEGSVGGGAHLYLSAREMDMTAGTLAKATYIDYRNEVTRWVNWVQPQTPIASLAPVHFAAYVKHLIVERGLGNRARKRTLTLLKAMFRWLDKNGHAPLPKFGTAFDAPRVTRQAIRQEKQRAGLVDHSERIVTGEEVNRLIAAAPTPNFKAMILLAVNCGLGPAELARLKWSDIHGYHLIYPRHKTGNDRQGYLWGRTRRALARCKQLKHTTQAIATHGENAPVFVTRRGKAFYREEIVGGKLKRCNAISVTLGRMVRALNMPGVTAYRLRHTFKTLGKAARDRDALNLCMGHKANSVEEGYDHEIINPQRIRRVAVMVRLGLRKTRGDCSRGAAPAAVSPERAA